VIILCEDRKTWFYLKTGEPWDQVEETREIRLEIKGDTLTIQVKTRGDVVQSVRRQTRNMCAERPASTEAGAKRYLRRWTVGGDSGATEIGVCTCAQAEIQKGGRRRSFVCFG
jgi:hypothetical protein